MLYQTNCLDVADLDLNEAFAQNHEAKAKVPTSEYSVPAGEPTDEELMQAVQQRDEDALRALHQRHGKLLRSIIARVVCNDPDVDDTLQDVLLGIWNGAAAFDAEKGKALGWMVTLARRRAIDRVRRRQAYHRAEERNRIEVQSMPEQFHTSASEDVDMSVRAEALKRVMLTLPEAQRTALELAFYRGLSQREIARELNVPLGTIKTRLELGVRKVRAAVLAMGGHGEWSMAA